MGIHLRTLTVLGVSFAAAPLAVRESLSYTPDAVRQLLASARIEGLDEALVVSTCNRTEFYLATSRGAETASAWLAHVRRSRSDDPIDGRACTFSRAEGDDAARHLFRVACGLESAILGDAHIGRQLKQALELAADAGTLGALLSHTFQQAFAVAKEARSQTEIGRGHASVGSAVAGLLRERRPLGGSILLLGAGVAARDVARQLSKWGLGPVTIVNRTFESGASLARRVGARALPWAQLDAALTSADVIVTALSAPSPVLTRTRLEPVLRSGGARRLVIDTGVPRAVERVDGLDYVGIDDIFIRNDQALDRRRRAVPAVEAAVEAAVARWRRWHNAQPGEAMLKSVFIEERAQRENLVEQILAAGFRGGRDDLDRMVRRAWRTALESHARQLRSWLLDGQHPLLVARPQVQEAPAITPVDGR